MIAFFRVDNRLIHGQIIEAWLPTLRVNRILVVDDQAAGNQLTRLAMGLAVPPPLEVQVLPFAQVDFQQIQNSSDRVLVLVREIQVAMRWLRGGSRFSALNVGNIHYSPGRAQVSPAVFLSVEEMDDLRELTRAGVSVELRAVPRDRPLLLAEVEALLSAVKS